MREPQQSRLAAAEAMAFNAGRTAWVSVKAGVAGAVGEYESQRPQLKKEVDNHTPWWKREFLMIKASDKGKIAQAAVRSATLAGAKDVLEGEKTNRQPKTNQSLSPINTYAPA